MPDLAPTCPNCGHGFAGLRRATRMFDCPSCGTTLFRDADALAPIGNHGEMHDTPMLFGLGDTVRVAGTQYDILGHIRFDYGRGFWDEMWAEDASGHGAWISLDEGDVVVQRPMPAGLVRAGLAQELELGQGVRIDGQTYVVTEADQATCAAFRGQLPERIAIGETHHFLNASGEDGTLISAELWDGGEAWFIGEWLDPFAVAVQRRDGAA